MLACRSSFAFALATAVLGAAALGATTLDEARSLHRAGALEAAVRAYRAVIDDADLESASLAVAHNNLCVVLDGLGELQAAEGACNEALELRRSLGDRLRLARTLNNLGLVLQHRGDYTAARQRYTEAFEINRDLDEPRAQAINLANLGTVATQAGRFDEALGFLRAVTELSAEHGGEDWAEEQRLVAELNRGVVLERLGAYREALGVYQDLLEESGKLRSTQLASVWVNSGVIYRNLGDPIQAIERFERAAALYRELGDLSALAHAELNVGIAQDLNLGAPEEAEASYRQALASIERTGDRGVEMEVLGYLGRLLLSRSRLDEAQSVFERELELARGSGSAEGVWVGLAGLGESERARGRYGAAWRHFQSAIEAIETGRSAVREAGYRASFFADKRTVYSGALSVLVELDRSNPGRGFSKRALDVAQKAKSRDLLDALGGLEADGAALTALDADALGHRLGPDVLLEYFVTDSAVLAWRVSAGAVRLFDLGEAEPVLRAVEAVHRALAGGSSVPEQSKRLLTSVLLDPLGPLPSGDARLWIAPDRRLQYLPFEILQATSTAPELLIERATVSYLPSASALPFSRGGRRARSYELGFLGLGGVEVPEPAAGSAWLSRLALEPLPGAVRELEAVSRRIRGKRLVVTGLAATEQAFREGASRGARVIHFATHTAIAERPEPSTAILLTPAGADDGLLEPREIARTTSKAELVVLAACATGLGASEDGRALRTLTGAFLATGSRAVLATLWPVGDQPAATFMDQFYYQLSRGLDPAQALRQTKLRFLGDERWRSPELWSGYVLIGWAPAVNPKRTLWIWLGALALVAALLALAVRARARR